jgi:hypothetical protein
MSIIIEQAAGGKERAKTVRKIFSDFRDAVKPMSSEHQTFIKTFQNKLSRLPKLSKFRKPTSNKYLLTEDKFNNILKSQSSNKMKCLARFLQTLENVTYILKIPNANDDFCDRTIFILSPDHLSFTYSTKQANSNIETFVVYNDTDKGFIAIDIQKEEVTHTKDSGYKIEQYIKSLTPMFKRFRNDSYTYVCIPKTLLRENKICIEGLLDDKVIIHPDPRSTSGGKNVRRKKNAVRDQARKERVQGVQKGRAKEVLQQGSAPKKPRRKTANRYHHKSKETR